MTFKKSYLRLAAAALATFAMGPSAHAQILSGEASEPLYPEVIVETDASYSDDAELLAFRTELAKATQARMETPRGKLYDPSPMMSLLGDSVEMFVARGRGAATNQQDFVSLGQHTPAKALEMLGRMSHKEPTTDALVQQRYGMGAIERLLQEPTIGVSSWLDGRICTASYGRLSWTEWLPLWHALGMKQEEWVIAADGFDDSPGAWPRRFQMVPISPSQKRSGGWLGVTAPNGGGSFFRIDEVHFAPYLNNHLCFEKQGGAWKVTAIAYRLD